MVTAFFGDFMKIAIIGYSGAGKSTLAKELGVHFSSPVLHLDQVNFIANWEPRKKAEALALVQEFMRQENWVIDGNYTSLCQKERLQEADLILFLEYNRFLCFWQALRRFWQFRGTVRDSAAPGCVEKMDWEFIRWILYDSRTAQRKEHYRQIAASYPQKLIAFKNRKDTQRFLENLQTEQRS